MRAPQWLILVGSTVFILALAISAIWEADIRWLHFFQAWMYIATIALSLRRNRWGFFIGISAAGLWAYAGLFVNGFVASGFRHLLRLDRPDQIIAVPAWLANVAVVIGCIWAYALLTKSPRDVARFVVACAVTTGFFALDMALFQPRYLSIFGRLLHPHWP